MTNSIAWSDERRLLRAVKAGENAVAGMLGSRCDQIRLHRRGAAHARIALQQIALRVRQAVSSSQV